MRILLFCLVTLFFAPAFASVEIRVAGESTLIDLNSKTETTLKANSENSVELRSASVVLSPGRIPAFLIPVYSGKVSVSVSAPLEADVIEKIREDEIDRRTSVLMSEIADIQSLVRNKQVSDAATRIHDLKAKYPSVTFLKFVDASILLLQGRKDDARIMTLDGLKSLPDYKEGQQFLKRLNGDH